MHVVCNKQIMVEPKARSVLSLLMLRNNPVAWRLFLCYHGMMSYVWKVGVRKCIWMFHSNQITLSEYGKVK